MSLDSFLAPVDIERNCPHCKICKTASQTTSLIEDPEILIFQIKRFDEHGNKIGEAIDVPTRIDLQSGSSVEGSLLPHWVPGARAKCIFLLSKQSFSTCVLCPEHFLHYPSKAWISPPAPVNIPLID